MVIFYETQSFFEFSLSSLRSHFQTGFGTFGQLNCVFQFFNFGLLFVQNFLQFHFFGFQSVILQKSNRLLEIKACGRIYERLTLLPASSLDDIKSSNSNFKNWQVTRLFQATMEKLGYVKNYFELIKIFTGHPLCDNLTFNLFSSSSLFARISTSCFRMAKRALTSSDSAQVSDSACNCSERIARSSRS
uniref:Uncharacterized protein n=1 Tax=Romanomermis culicivorax TaxID=13658 RepID=A0A915KI10_ROMCU